MKPILLFLLCAFAGAASAQSTTPKMSADVTPPKATGDNPSMQDPRVCLEFPTREQVIACAEKYRHKRAAAKP
jgi:hypothetical protein